MADNCALQGADVGIFSPNLLQQRVILISHKTNHGNYRELYQDLSGNMTHQSQISILNKYCRGSIILVEIIEFLQTQSRAKIQHFHLKVLRKCHLSSFLAV